MFPAPYPPAGYRHFGQPSTMVAAGGAACEADYSFADGYSFGQPNRQLAAETIEVEAPPPRFASELLQLGALCYRDGTACGVGEFVGPADVAKDHPKQDDGFLFCELEQAVSQVISGDTAAVAMEDCSSSKDKVGLRLSPEERKEKIHRYMEKRNKRNFTKTIKYACRKTLADTRPRVRGRFAKLDERGEETKSSISNHDFHKVAVKEEEMLDSDILELISGVNSFAYNWALESWI
ncbi:uncharacterized protein LOC122040164 [Zingiber officinale]|uniref:CCT domain-containing protein n=1 Tax=Zingiber officinale TaxID=94328 RepID=A0A8J5LMD3_ZINOF|nr:uncharacterized protein LOC122040164 [Zingiber officinale]KAG6531340.1 hypothetical protein ZIOFF_005145 [Zingiber officinale]